ncbi:MAG: hypothetical protein HYW93_00965 [Thaumarchaeota archaeon]|nr:hypothetical protein [Nitrososphaerota archaeon]
MTKQVNKKMVRVLKRRFTLIELMASFRASPVFALVVLVTLGVAGLINLLVLLMQLQPGFMGMAHFTEAHHRIHDLTFGFLFTTGVVGILAQLRKPSKNVAGQLMALIPWGALVLAATLTNTWVFAPLPVLGGLTLLATILHPTGRNLFSSFSVSRVNRVTLALVAAGNRPRRPCRHGPLRFHGGLRLHRHRGGPLGEPAA